MNRREILRISLVLASGAAASLGAGRGFAQSSDIIDDMIYKRPWSDQKVFSNLRRLSASLIDLRIVYSGPNGYEAEEKFATGVWDIWHKALGENSNEGYALVGKIAPSFDGDLADKLGKQMNLLLEENGKKFVTWLEEIGIAPGSRLQEDFIRAQALFAIAAGALLAGGDLTLFKDFTWVYPFC